MKYCTKCGTAVDDNAVFCSKCGNPFAVSNSADESAASGDMFAAANNVTADSANQAAGGASFESGFAPMPEAPQKKSSKKKKIIIGSIIGGVVLIAAVVVSLILLLGGNEKFSFKDYMNVELMGNSGSGTLSLHFDEDKLYDDLKDKKIDKPEQIMLLVTRGLSYEADKTSELSNGDLVTVTFNFDTKIAKSLEKFDVEFDTSDYTYTVSGLQEITTVDPFKDIELSVSGIFPDDYEIEIKNNSDDEFIKSLNFYAEDVENPEDGVTIKLRSYNTPDESGYDFSQTSKTFKIKDYCTYDFDKSLVDDDFAGSWDKSFNKILPDWFEDYSDVYSYKSFKSYTAPEYKGYVFYSPDSVYYDHPCLFLIYSVDIKAEDSEDDTTEYLSYEISDIYYDKASDSLKSNSEDNLDSLDSISHRDDLNDLISDITLWFEESIIEVPDYKADSDDNTDGDNSDDSDFDFDLGDKTYPTLKALVDSGILNQDDDGSGSLTSSANGDKLVLEYKFSEQLCADKDDADDFSDLMEAFMDESSDDLSDTLKNIKNAVDDSDNITMVIRYVDADGTVLFETEIK